MSRWHKISQHVTKLEEHVLRKHDALRDGMSTSKVMEPVFGMLTSKVMEPAFGMLTNKVMMEPVLGVAIQNHS